MSTGIKRLEFLLFGFCINFAAAPAISEQVRVAALFSDSAYLIYKGEKFLLKKGQSHPSGIKLLAANSTEATLLVQGKKRKVGLGLGVAVPAPDSASAATSNANKNIVVIPVSSDGHYWTNVTVNGKQVRGLVDTGASSLAINASEARKLGIRVDRFDDAKTQTAGGIVSTKRGKVGKVTLGGLVAYNVDVSILSDAHLGVPLIGMSVLKNFDIERSGGELRIIGR